MKRLPTLLIALALAAGPAPVAASSVLPAASDVVAPDAASSTLPPDSAAVAPTGATTTAVDSTLRRLGTLRISGIGLVATVYYWGCGNSIVPNVAIRWGCQPSNNQFIAGHAYGVFHPYYLAYARHQLRAGLVATFTNTTGHVTRYRLEWMRVVTGSYVLGGLTGEQWAWNNTSRSALTLQTCWGSTNKYRIVTRFVRI